MTRVPAEQAHAKKSLPAYAVPVFVRVQNEFAATATMKVAKGTGGGRGGGLI